MSRKRRGSWRSRRIQEDLIVGLIQLLLMTVAALFGAVVARRSKTTAPRILGAVFALSGVAALLIGLAKQQPAVNLAGFVAGVAVLLATVFALTKLPRPAVVAAAVVGGIIALYATSVTMVLSLYGPEVAPREHAWLWPMAVMGFARNVDHGALADPERGWPLWVELSMAIGPLAILLQVTAALTLTYTIQRGRAATAASRELATAG
ncbi:hypothetical protein [Krasilnikovia sp. M28-CT-15]|uniref:hypothetical protein n=1 Tax=Krasilnikovia sp. M28-CT-15 TaxID=3373540 RepID=UPI0038775FC6